jgi:general secretion pathway protein G
VKPAQSGEPGVATTGGAPSTRDRSPRGVWAVDTATVCGGALGEPAVNRRSQNTALAATAAHTMKAIGRAFMCRLSSRRRAHTPLHRAPMRTMTRLRAARRGFTLIELLVVLVIIGVLGALIVPNLFSSVDDARRTAARTDVNTLMQSLQRYKLDNLRYPTAEQGLQALVTKPTASPIPPNWRAYQQKLPNDPWGRPYQFVNPGVKGEVDVFSFGADGQPGGEGNDADIGSWQ